MIIYNKYIPFGRFKRIAIWPVILWKTYSPYKLHYHNHEKIHLVQQFECMCIGILLSGIASLFTGFEWWYLIASYLMFYVVYVINWIVELIKMIFGADEKAYKDIWFEKEAYQNQKDKNYLKNRKPFAWLKYK